MTKEFYLKHHSFHIKAIFAALKDVFEKSVYADKAIEKVMKANKYWDVRERAFVSDVTYDMVRNWRLIVAASGVEPEAKLSDRNLWMIFGAYLVFDGYQLPESNYFKGIHERKIVSQLEKFHKIRKIRESIPDWLDALGEKELGKDWDKVIRALNQRPATVLRANSLKTNPKELQALLEAENITEASLVVWSPDAVELKFPRNVFRTEAFHKGLFEVQDASSQMVSEFLNVQSGMRVVDACAGAGGKTLHLKQ